MQILVLRHDNLWGLSSFVDPLQKGEAKWTTVDLHAGEAIPADLSSFDAMIVMGGPMNVWQTTLHPWLLNEIESIATFVRLMKRPYLGICLGHQLLSVALGGSVGAMDAPEIGVRNVSLTPQGKKDRLLSTIGPSFPTFQWHYAQITQIPLDCTILAGTDICATQIIRWGERAYCLQYHAEVSAETIATCSSVRSYMDALDKTLGMTGRDQFVAEATEKLPRFRRDAEQVITRFLRIVDDMRTDDPAV